MASKPRLPIWACADSVAGSVTSTIALPRAGWANAGSAGRKAGYPPTPKATAAAAAKRYDFIVVSFVRIIWKRRISRRHDQAKKTGFGGGTPGPGPKPTRDIPRQTGQTIGISIGIGTDTGPTSISPAPQAMPCVQGLVPASISMQSAQSAQSAQSCIAWLVIAPISIGDAAP